MAVVMVAMSELHKQQLIVGPWEVPVLAAVHGDDAIAVTGEVSVEREPPEPHDEYERLVNRYKADEESRVPFVAMVYGHPPAGIQALGKAIGAAQKPQKQATG